ncbi:uncharacterized protein B0I36DRAFT_37791 [Microdochium trichocladiopsis]|uniref:mRNA 3'-end-processing protein RNA14 n=1 Tax=Microdochium trichocladiopsis TaxID=1682393 RepID=A0A9P8XUU1_9PEZI|nr:uncharacterized protein B0I36DRAFT_37791 [Microdochium trichocladiopsis]KAH7018311.1 hypothetical protein B0I36DRAFT_37791 [Microdochium trichocladiopsis]
MASPGPDESASAQQDWATGEWGGDAEHQNIEHSEHDAATAYDPASKPAESSPSDSASNEEDGGEYDPESVSYDPASAPTNDTILPDAPAPAMASASASDARPAKKPKTAGGFIVGSSDDEDEDDATPAPAPVTVPTTAIPRQSSPSVAHPQNPAMQPSGQPNTGSAPAMSERLQNDTIGLLEDRVKEDPRGDMDAWKTLIQEQQRRNKIEDARAVYERFFAVFPQAAEIWLEYLTMELSLDNFQQAEAIFGRTLLSVPHVDLWTAYLNYIRRRHDLNDPTGQARQVVSTSYEFVLQHIGQDRDAGQIWSDYIQFLKSGPGQVGGSSWQDQQKMDILRKAYQRAICVPMPNLNALWKEYNQFELGLNKTAGQKFLQERSPSYMTARTANTHLENLTRGLVRTTLPRLPPAPGFDGDTEYQEQITLWKAWIAWEKDDPLVLQQDDPKTYQQRILHVYKQALMALRFWPELWVEAAEWCFEQNMINDKGQDTGSQFLIDGVAANPESPLLALKHADRIESTHQVSEGDEGKAALAQAVRAPYDQAFDTLYDMIKKLKDRETAAVMRIRDDPTLGGEEDEGEINENGPSTSLKQERIKALQTGFAAQVHLISQQISYLWIALARAFRRIQGQGKTASGKPTTGIRAIFTESRSKGRLTSDVYVAIANMEWDIYQDPVATKIFERGAKLFPDEEHFIVEYLKHLHARHDFTNARVVFSQTVKRFKEKGKDSPEMLTKLKPLYTYFHSYEAKFGELAQIKQLEQEMTELFPFDPSLSHFAARFATKRFNPLSARVIVSPGAQMRPKPIMQSVEQPLPSMPNSPAPVLHSEPSPRPQFLQATNSPKRPYQVDEEEFNPPRKIARGVSPLKGAAGRRLDQQRRAQGGGSSQAAAPLPIPRDITFLLSLIPAASSFNAPRFSPDGMVRLIANTAVPDYRDWQATQARNARTESTSRAHTRQASSEYPAYAQNRDSPGPPSASGRPISPFGGARGVQISAPYRNSPLRPGSSGDFEPPQAGGYQAPGPSPFNPASQAPQPPPANTGYWQGGAYGQPPNSYGQPPQQYGGWQ